jgi:hypothetical protein
MRVFLKRFALRGRDPAVADENLYRYCENDPVNATDAAGLDALKDSRKLTDGDLSFDGKPALRVVLLGKKPDGGLMEA